MPNGNPGLHFTIEKASDVTVTPRKRGQPRKNPKLTLDLTAAGPLTTKQLETWLWKAA